MSRIDSCDVVGSWATGVLIQALAIPCLWMAEEHCWIIRLRLWAGMKVVALMKYLNPTTWKQSMLATHNGRNATLCAEPDEHGSVELLWEDGTTSNVDTAELTQEPPIPIPLQRREAEHIEEAQVDMCGLISSELQCVIFGSFVPLLWMSHGVFLGFQLAAQLALTHRLEEDRTINQGLIIILPMTPIVILFQLGYCGSTMLLMFDFEFSYAAMIAYAIYSGAVGFLMTFFMIIRPKMYGYQEKAYARPSAEQAARNEGGDRLYKDNYNKLDPRLRIIRDYILGLCGHEQATVESDCEINQPNTAVDQSIAAVELNPTHVNQKINEQQKSGMKQRQSELGALPEDVGAIPAGLQMGNTNDVNISSQPVGANDQHLSSQPVGANDQHLSSQRVGANDQHLSSQPVFGAKPVGSNDPNPPSQPFFRGKPSFTNEANPSSQPFFRGTPISTSEENVSSRPFFQGIALAKRQM